MESVLQENVLVTDDGHALLTNFGCSFFHDRASGRAYFPPLPGALRWMAPEGIEDEKNVTAYRDVWAFAMTVMVCSSRNFLYFAWTWSTGIIHS